MPTRVSVSVPSAAVVTVPFEPDDRVELQERDGRRRAGEVDAAVLNALDDGRRQCGGVDLEADRQGGRRVDRRSR